MQHAFLVPGLHAHAPIRRQQHRVPDPPPAHDAAGRRILAGRHTTISTASLGLLTHLPKASTSKSTQQSIPIIDTIVTAGGNDDPRPPHDSLNDDSESPSLALDDAYLPGGITRSGLAHIPREVSQPRFVTSTEDPTKTRKCLPAGDALPTTAPTFMQHRFFRPNMFSPTLRPSLG
jgi:hypothetical protein